MEKHGVCSDEGEEPRGVKKAQEGCCGGPCGTDLPSRAAEEVAQPPTKEGGDAQVLPFPLTYQALGAAQEADFGTKVKDMLARRHPSG